ncbi:hypothetical protein [Sphaerisporangium perillae]|uniref:hypothetical protein n=1 Tax=Sphaerisporangium perillae TaxID=2935860 RepID=UPI00200C44D9|nr:hypothetical protein [Sphaerisporangium perillae]
MRRIFGQPRGRPQPGRPRGELLQIDVTCRGEQRQPTAHDEQAPMFVEGLAGVDQVDDVAEVPPYPHE